MNWKWVICSKTSYLLHWICDDQRLKINIVNPIYFVFNKFNGYFEKINENKYLTLVPTNESKEIIKEYDELWNKIKDLIRTMTKKSDDYDESKLNSIRMMIYLLVKQ